MSRVSAPKDVPHISSLSPIRGVLSKVSIGNQFADGGLTLATSLPTLSSGD